MKTNHTLKKALFAGAAAVATAAMAAFGFSSQKSVAATTSRRLYLDNQSSARITAVGSVQTLTPSTQYSSVLAEVTSNYTPNTFYGSTSKAYCYGYYMHSTVGTNVVTLTFYFSLNGLTDFTATSYQVVGTGTAAGVTMTYTLYGQSLSAGSFGTAIGSGSMKTGITVTPGVSGIQTVAIVLTDNLTSSGQFGFGLSNATFDWAC
jgi:hypothetical protein